MSCDPGFEDLTNGRRGSLCVLLDRINARHERTTKLLAAMVNDESYSAAIIKKAQSARARYESLARTVELQFPEFRADRRGKFTLADARTNAEILMEMSGVDSDLSLLSRAAYRDLRDWFDKDRSMPRLAPLFATESMKKRAVKKKEPAKTSAEK